MLIRNVTQQTTVAQHARQADTFLTRLLGLMGRHDFGDMDCLLFSPSNAIHTCFMRFPIDAIFLGREHHVLALYPSLSPWRMTRIIRHAHYVLELPVNTILYSRTQVGDRLEWGFSPATGG